MTVVAFPGQSRWPGRGLGDAQVVADWVEWLRGKLDPGWRLNEWNADLLLFVGDPHHPKTSVAVCQITGCGSTTLSPGYCKTCLDAYRQSGMAKEELRPRTRGSSAGSRRIAFSLPAQCRHVPETRSR